MKRYEIVASNHDGWTAFDGLSEEQDGEWVRYTDASAIERERDALRDELERERMRLAGISAIALANTPESAAIARQCHVDYVSASMRDVCDAVDREMALRERVAALERDANERESCEGCDSFDPLSGYTDGPDSPCRLCRRFERLDNFKKRGAPHG